MWVWMLLAGLAFGQEATDGEAPAESAGEAVEDAVEEAAEEAVEGAEEAGDAQAKGEGEEAACPCECPPEKPDEGPPPTSLAAELGGSWTTGNTQMYTLTGNLIGSHKFGFSELGLKAGALVGRTLPDSDGDGILSKAEREGEYVDTARTLFADLRYDAYVVSDRDSFYLLVGTLSDPFSGFDLRTRQQIGYSRMVILNDTTQLRAEIGVDYAQENYVDSVEQDSQNVFAGAVTVGLNHKFNENVAFVNKLELFENLIHREDFRLVNQAGLTMNLSSAIKVKFSHTLRFDNEPVVGFRTTDQITMATIVASII